MWRGGGAKEGKKYQILIRTTVLRASPHYRKMELQFTIYASSATVYVRDMKKNMTCKTHSS